MSSKQQGNLYIIAAPSGAGKTSLVKAMLARLPQLQVSISHTTRPMRPGETDGKDYFFIDRSHFEQRIEEKAFLEHASVFDNYYGTSRDWVLAHLEKGIDVILEIDWQGARQVKLSYPEAISIFIFPPSHAALQERLANRGQDSEVVMQKRLSQAQLEMSHHGEYDYIVVNDDFNVALEHLCAIITAERLRHVRQNEALAPLIADLLT